MNESLLDGFRVRSRENPEESIFTYVDDRGRDQTTMRAGDCRRAADNLAGFLTRKCGLAAGDRVLLVYPPSLDFIDALLGCLFAGIIPVPLPPPNPIDLSSDLERFAALAESSGARAVLTNARYAQARQLGMVRNVLRRPWKRWPDLPWHATDTIKPGAFEPPPYRSPLPSDIAFLQYTSGSTSLPRGVMITHGNLDHQLALNARELGLESTSRAVMWVPQFHDFGLISGILSSLRGNGHLYMMSPLAFIQRPAVWLEVMSRVQATHTAAPNFAYELAVRKTTHPQRAALNLRALRVAMCAAEPVHHETMRRFTEAFAVSGMRPEAFCPAYGLAEHTVGVSVAGRGTLRVARDELERDGVVRVVSETDRSDAKTFVACGEPSQGVRVRIVDPETLALCSDGRVGEIWVDSPSKAAGYFRLEEESARTFRARLQDANDTTEYLRTGDLGFVHHRQIFITGRLKDVIIVRGRNLYPQDLEESIRDCHPMIRPGGVVAFSIDEPTETGTDERIVMLAEVNAKLDRSSARAVVDAIRERVLKDHQQSCRTVLLCSRGAVKKTTSGKVMRRACREAFLNGELARATVHADHADTPAPTEIQPAKTNVPSIIQGLAPEASDPRLRDLDPDFQRIVADLASSFRRMTHARKGRVFHKTATTAQGSLRVLDNASIPRHRFFAAGAQYPVIVRHANGVQDDDAAVDNRGATLRVLNPADPSLDQPLLDLLLTTGRCFSSGSAQEFAHWMSVEPATRDALVRAEPHRGIAAWEMFRRPSAFASLHYYSKVASHYFAEDGSRWFVRYRLRPADGTEEIAQVQATGLLPPEIVPRDAADKRSRTFMHEEFRAQITSRGVAYRLQLQLRPFSEDANANDDALDCTRPWPESQFPWHDAAHLELNTLVDSPQSDALRFDPFHAPAELALPLAHSAKERASLGHARSLVYEIAARARLGEALPAPLQSLLDEREAPALRVCVIGAGASGLSAARALEQKGHRVTVLERSREIAGKCASFEADGRIYDWGGHLCTGLYTRVAALAEEIGATKEPATPTLLYDLERRTIRERAADPTLRDEFLRYQSARNKGFGDITATGLHRVADRLAAPASQWFRDQDLSRLGQNIGVNYTSCGYGYLGDPSLSALYLLKAAEMGGILSAGTPTELPESWTLVGGMGAFWERVAAGLNDLRTGVQVTRVERRDARVIVHTGAESQEYDRLVIASPLDEALQFLDETEEEHDLFSKILYLDYHTIAVRARDLPRQGFYLLEQHCQSDGTRGHAVAFHHRYPDSDVYLFYLYGRADLDNESLLCTLRQDIERMGGRLDEIIDQRQWRYFPHASSSDIQSGFYARLEALQGTRNTWYVGSLFNFELIECNVAYAQDLVERHFSRRTASVAATSTRPLTDDAGEQLRSAVRAAASTPSRATILRTYLAGLFKEELRLEKAPGPTQRFIDLGLDSLKSVEIFQRLTHDTGLTLAPVLFFEYPTLELLSAHLAAMFEGPRENSSPHIHARSRETADFTQFEEVVFADWHGLAATMDIFVPTARSNGLGIVDVVSALWASGREVIKDHDGNGTYESLCRKGFTVFAPRTGSVSRFTGLEMVLHLRHAIRWIKRESAAYGVDPERLGMIAGSSGGQLAFMSTFLPDEEDTLLVGSGDSRVRAIVAFCPMTTVEDYLDRSSASPARAQLATQLAFVGDASGQSEDEYRRRLLAISPVHRIPPRPPATLVLHAQRDKLAPFAQAERFVAALREAGGHAELIARDSDRHPWPEIKNDMPLAADWLERTLQGFSSRDPITTRANAGTWFSSPRPLTAPAQRLVCFPHAGGSAAMFDCWAEQLPDGVELRALELPGRRAGLEETKHATLESLLDVLEDEIAPLLDRPFAFFGHSFGSIVAYELSRRLQRKSKPSPFHLFVSGFAAPQHYEPGRAWSVAELRDAVGSQELSANVPIARAALAADLALAWNWKHANTPNLQAPITALAGEADPLVGRDEIEGWRERTSSTFTSHQFAGDHFYVIPSAPRLLALLSSVLTTASGERNRSNPDAMMSSLVARWRARPYALAGSWNLFDLCWLARISSEEDPLTPAFPEALDTLLSTQREVGSVGECSPHPYSNFVVALAFANTLVRWDTSGRHDDAIRRALDYAVREHERSLRPLYAGTHESFGRHFLFNGMAGRWLLPSREYAELLERGERHLSVAHRQCLDTYLHVQQALTEPATGEQDTYEQSFESDSMLLHFGEYFPASAMKSDAARAHAARAFVIPGMTTALAAHYYEVTRDPEAYRLLRDALTRPLDGLRPGGRLQEVHFALYYLAQSGVDLRRYCAPEIEEFVGSLTERGVGVEPGATVPDCDGTAVALHLCRLLDLPARMPTRVLESFWRPERESYQSADGRDSYSVSTVLHVMAAYADAPDVSREEQLAVWRRTIGLLESRPWSELHHLSPFYVWEKMVSIVGANRHRFSEVPTSLHEEALALILRRQRADGGFSSEYLDESNIEETALALIALNSAIACGIEGLEERAERAREFLLQRWRGGSTAFPALWAGKLLFAPTNVVEAMIVAAVVGRHASPSNR